MFPSRSEKETTSNNRIAKELVDDWSHSVYNKNTRFAHMRSFDNDRILFQGASGKRLMKKAAGMHSTDGDLNVVKFLQYLTMTHKIKSKWNQCVASSPLENKLPLQEVQD